MAGENPPEIRSTEQNIGAFEKAVARAELLNKAARQAAEYSIKASQEALSRAEAISKEARQAAEAAAKASQEAVSRAEAISREATSAIEELEAIVNASGKEEEAHQFLKNNSIILGLTSDIEPISKFKLGKEYVTDFVIHERPIGYIFIEIETPDMELFKKATNPPERKPEFNHAIQQIENWRAWINRNYYYINRELDGVSPNPLCWLIIGRRTKLSSKEIEKLAEINEQHRNNYVIFTYDDLIDKVKTIISKFVYHAITT